jgi:predicted permease
MSSGVNDMSLWSRLANVFRGDRLNREIDEELQSHIEEAIEEGRDPAEARKAFGSPLRQREASRDTRLLVWLDSLRADAIFGWRQLMKRKVTSAAAILSLGLAIGACTAAFRIIDALLLRPLPVSAPERLYVLGFEGIRDDGKLATGYSGPYPMFRRMRAAVRGQAELLAISWAGRNDLTYSTDDEMEKAHVQYVSGWMFDSFGIRPALGRLFTENDDLIPSAIAVAVLSYDYWSHRFGKDPKVIGRSFRFGKDLYAIVGVAAPGFTGTEPGTMVDVWIPTMMNSMVEEQNSNWFRTMVRPKRGIPIDPIHEKLRAVFRAFREEQVKRWVGAPEQAVKNFISQTLLLEPAASGSSQMQHDYRRALIALGVLVILVLLIACANVANLMTAQAALRAREMALRVSIGAGTWRLAQLVLVEGAGLGFFSAAVGGLLAWWSAPFIIARINPPDRPVRLALPADWRVLGFALALTLGVTLLFALAPALRASSVKPASALKGGEPHSRRRMMHSLIALQSAFCFFVILAAGLFVATFDRLSHQATGFSAERLLNVQMVAQQAQPADFWYQVVEHVRGIRGAESVALAGFSLMSGTGWNRSISINSGRPSPEPIWLVNVSPGWLAAMRIPLLDGRDFRTDDASPKVAIINQAFAKRYFPGQNPVGKSFGNGHVKEPQEIIGLVGDARYTDMRGPIQPTAYVPFRSLDPYGPPGGTATLVVRTTNPNPVALASILRREIPRAKPGLRVSNIITQQELVEAQTLRERLLAMLALFFAGVALLLAAIGLCGVLEYSIHSRRREIGIRIAIGAPALDIARRVTIAIFSMVLVGAAAGLALGLSSARYIETLLYQVNATDLTALAVPSLAMLVSALAAALPAVFHAIAIDPADTLRAE